MAWILSCLPQRGIEQKVLSLLVKVFNKTALPISIFKFNSTFSLFFINLATLWSQKHKCFRTYISYQKSSHAELFLQFAPLKLLRMFWIHCFHVTRVLRKPYWRRSYLATFFVCCCKFMYKYFSIFVHFRRIFFCRDQSLNKRDPV